MKRKQDRTSFEPRKKQRVPPQETKSHVQPYLQYSILGLYYSHVFTLGSLLQDWLPSTSRVRRRRLEQFDTDFPQCRDFLSQVVVGFQVRPSDDEQNARRDQLVAFTQTQRAGKGCSREQRSCDLSEIIDFAIWTLFQKHAPLLRSPSHLLCNGYQRIALTGENQNEILDAQIPGIARMRDNPNVDLFKQLPWTEVANLLGRDAETIMLALLLDCGIFQQVAPGSTNLYQLSGEPLYQKALHPINDPPRAKTDFFESMTKAIIKPASIAFVRNRMYHARPALSRKGKVQLGLKHIHAFNRYSDIRDFTQDVCIMQYIFPRQFGLHNVFTSRTDPSETSQAYKDYTMREKEIALLSSVKVHKIPRRLRGPTLGLIQKMRGNHHRCSYSQLLRHYCPVLSSRDQTYWHDSVKQLASSSADEQAVTQTSLFSTHKTKLNPFEESFTTSFIPYATPVSQVVAFSQAVLSRLLPRDCFGNGVDGTHNWTSILQAVGNFIQMRRFESMSLHEVCQNIRIKCMPWLRPPFLKHNEKLSISDCKKRLEILQELIYYMFDSLLIPLIRSNFYVTETGSHRNQMLYFRHDIWKKMAEPALSMMRSTIFEPLNPRQLKHRLHSNTLGCSQMRCLPKEHGIRPIVNLKRKGMKIVNGKPVLSKSINKQLEPIFSILNLERSKQPEKLASAIFSVNEIQDKLKRFKANLTSTTSSYYFVKVDIRSCFDTIPQEELLTIVDEFLLQKGYQIFKHVEMKKLSAMSGCTGSRAITKWVSRAAPTGDNGILSLRSTAQLAVNKRQLVYVGTDQRTSMKTSQIRKMLIDHLQNNVIRIGHKHFRQKRGIPQGSVLSTLLCNLFYGDFERRELSFLDLRQSLLLRLTDDFLLITTSEDQARQFSLAMVRGNIKHGITVNAEKSLVNFEVTVDGHKIPRLHGGYDFPYCGISINTHNLQLRRDRKPRDRYVANGLSVARSGRIGVQMRNKILSSLKRQWYPMLMDGSLNTREQILRSIFECFVESGMRMYQYMMWLPKSRRPSELYQIDLCTQLIVLGNRLMKRSRAHEGVIVTTAQMSWLAAAALSKVLDRKQCKHKQVMNWLKMLESSTRKSMNTTTQQCEHMIEDVMKSFTGYVY